MISTWLRRLKEAGRVITTANEAKVQAAITALEAAHAGGADSAESRSAIDEAQTIWAQLEEAVWDTAYIDNLPDSSFLYIAPGGEKDEDGKTTPRSLRYFPVYDGDGGVDIPHLRNALARIPQSKVGQAAKDKALKKAQALAKKNLPSYQESDRRTLQEVAGLSFDQVRELIRHALRARMGLSGNDIGGPWVTDVYDDYFIYENNDKYFQASYSIENGAAVLGDPMEVERKTVYEPVKQAEARTLYGDGVLLLENYDDSNAPWANEAPKIMALQEKAVRDDGTADIKIIDAGWGSSGHYSKEVLQRDAPTAWPTGLHMYLDHPTLEEEKQRPERSVRDLAAVTIAPAAWNEAGWDGPGVYAPAKVFEPYQPFISEYAPHIGVSHRSIGKAVKGEAEGRKGPIIERIVAGKSADFVTKPGRGGKIRELFEAFGEESWIDWNDLTLETLKRRRPDLIEGMRDDMKQAIYDEKNRLKEAERMTDERIAELEEANRKLTEEKETNEKELARLREADIMRQAEAIVTEKVGASDLPDMAKARLIKTLAKNPMLTEAGELDSDKFTQHITEAITEEIEYVAQVKTGQTSGGIYGMGSGGATGDEGRKALKESFKIRYLNEGMTEEVAEKMAEAAARGR